MKKLALVLFTASLLTLAAADPGHASGLPEVSAEPGSFSYGLMQAQEAVSLAFTFGQAKKAEKRVRFAEKRLAVAKRMVDHNKTDKAEAAMRQYSNQVSAARRSAENSGRADIVQSVNESTAIHQAILQDVLEQVPEQAREGIRTALENSQVQLPPQAGGQGQGQQEPPQLPEQRNQTPRTSSGYMASGRVVQANSGR